MRPSATCGLAAYLVLCLWGCGEPNAAGSTGVETTNGFSLVVRDTVGRPVVGARVVARPSTWTSGLALPMDSSVLEGKTDSVGSVHFPRLPSPDWTFEARSACLAGMLNATSADTAFAIILGRTGFVSGIATSGTRVVVAGLVHGTVAGPDGAFVLDSLPAGVLPFVGEIAAGGSTAIRYAVPVRSGDTTPIQNPAWKRARSFYLNTTSTGAAVAGNVLDFPVLIRLNNGNFDFSQAQPNGEDLRFAKADNTPLPFEIERFDPVAGLAEIWVKMDTVFGNDTAQSVELYWGGPALSAIPASGLGSFVSDGTKVFDTAFGFQGVWHMAQRGGDSVLDATANHYNGISSGLTAASSMEGIAGRAFAFDGVAGSIVIQVPDTTNNRLNFSSSGPFTFSAWVSADSSSTASGVVWDKGYRTPSEYYLRLGTNTQFIFSVSEPTGYRQRSWPAQLKSWKHVVSVRDGTRQYLYVDGICVDSVGTFIAGALATTHGGTVYIGRSSSNSQPPNYFRGEMDELEISNQALGSDWIKLAYMNQRADDKLTVTR